MPTFLAGQRLTASALNHMYAAADASNRTVTAATMTPISSQYAIAANDAAVGTAYRLTCWGVGAQGSSAQNLSVRANTISGVGLNLVTIDSGFCSTTAQFRWMARMTTVASAIGSGGTITGFLEGLVVQTGVTSPSINFNSEWSGSAINTSTNWGIEIDCEWGSVTGTPSITCNGTLFERLG